MHRPALGDEARVLDVAGDLGFRETEVGTGGGDHVLLDHQAAEVVGAEAQRDLADLAALGDPGGLHVGEVAEEDARNGQRLQIFDGGGLGPAAAA